MNSCHSDLPVEQIQPVSLPTDRYNLLVLLGPTAVGKTSLGVRLARHFGAEIISADSRQVYRHLDLGSGKDLDEYIARRHKNPISPDRHHRFKPGIQRFRLSDRFL